MDYWAVSCDGRLLERGLSRAQAEAFADKMAKGTLSKRAQDSRRVPEFNIIKDREYIAGFEMNHKLMKEGR